jgi:hypothetical protein
MNKAKRKRLALKRKEIGALRSYRDDLLRELWLDEMRDRMQKGPPRGWRPREMGPS